MIQLSRENSYRQSLWVIVAFLAFSHGCWAPHDESTSSSSGTEALDKSNKASWLGVEVSFMNQVTKFKQVDCFKKIRFFTSQWVL
jgi:hypothetical protein